MSLIEISRLLGMPKTTAFGLIATMEEQGFLEQDNITSKYRLGLSIIELSNTFNSRLDIRQETIYYLKTLSDKYEKNTHMTMFSRSDVIYLESFTPAGALTFKTVVGSRAPANCTSTGKAFLASLSETELDGILNLYPPRKLTINSITSIPDLKTELKYIQDMGYAVDNEESTLGVRGVGIVVRNRFNKALIGISISGLSAYFSDELIEKCAWDLNEVSKKLSVKIGNKTTI